MPIDTQHPYYRVASAKIQKVRDFLTGEEAVKDKGETYLPYPADLESLRNEAESRDKTGYATIAAKHYAAYKGQATVPDITAHAQIAAVGIVAGADQSITIPARLEYLRDNVSGTGIGIVDLYLLAVRETLATGSYTFLADADDNGMPRIYGYRHEDVINWITNDDRLSLCVLRETYSAATDRFETGSEEQLRLLSVEGGYLVQEVYRNGTLFDAIPQQDHRGNPVQEIPIFRAGSTVNGWVSAIDNQIPLLPVARCALKAYNLSAKLNHLIDLMSRAMLVTTGINASEDKPRSFSSATAAHLPAQCSANLLQVSPVSFPYIKTQMDDTVAEGRSYGASIVASAKVEAADAIRAKAASQQATLRSVAVNVASALDAALKAAAAMIGIPADAAGFSVSGEFDSKLVDSALLSVIGGHVAAGIIPREVLYNQYREEGVTTLDDAGLSALLETLPAPANQSA